MLLFFQTFPSAQAENDPRAAANQPHLPGLLGNVAGVAGSSAVAAAAQKRGGNSFLLVKGWKRDAETQLTKEKVKALGWSFQHVAHVRDPPL